MAFNAAVSPLSILSLDARFTFHSDSQFDPRFIDGYQKGLNGTQVAWAIRKYRGHRVLPEYIMKEFDNSHSSL